ncbi:porin [Piscinibacter sakaiensis]|uniref:porin n=1 Tax=Piscinibacter sakaiensis TaxID=1547922 RepID=UPI003AAF6AFC
MNRHLLLAAIATLAAGGAFAQGAVTAYGRVNATVERTRNANQTVYRLNDNASRVGFRGIEDLGGGMSASFLIEHGFNVDTGAQSGTAMWGRESWVAIGGSFGRTRLGNMGATNAYYTTADYISLHNHDTGSSADAFYLYPGRATNMIAYTSPEIDGWVIDAQASLSENSQLGRTQVLTGNYDKGPWHVGISYLQSGAGVRGPRPKELGLRVLYEFGALSVGGYFIRNDDSFGTDTRRNALRGVLMYAIGPGELHLNMGYAEKVKGNAIANDDARQVTLGYNHNLSKRTKAYTYYTRVTDDAQLYGGKFSSIAVGVRHNF